MKVYTYNDWLEGRIAMEPHPEGGHVFNDSSKFGFLAPYKLPYDVWNEIQFQQAATYERLIQREYEDRRLAYDGKAQIRANEVKRTALDDLEAFFRQHNQVYKDVINRRSTRGIPIGAKFIPPKWTVNPPDLPSLYPVNRLDDSLYDPNLMFEGEVDYIVVEAYVRLRDYIEGRVVGKPFPLYYFKQSIGLYHLQFLEDRLIQFEKKIEKRPDGTYSWSGLAYECAAFIEFLFDREILAERSRKEAKNDLQVRYTHNLEEQKPGKVKAWIKGPKGTAFMEVLERLYQQIPPQQ